MINNTYASNSLPSSNLPDFNLFDSISRGSKDFRSLVDKASRTQPHPALIHSRPASLASQPQFQTNRQVSEMEPNADQAYQDMMLDMDQELGAA
jgi:hypothetical protein